VNNLKQTIDTELLHDVARQSARNIHFWKSDIGLIGLKDFRGIDSILIKTTY